MISMRIYSTLLFVSVVLFMVLYFSDARSQQDVLVERVIVQGAQRIDERTILEYLEFKPGDEYSVALGDSAVKSLYGTGLFANITIVREGGDVIVNVQENPLINRLAFEGNERIDDAILGAEVGLSQRTVYSRGKVQAATRRILDVYHRRGRYAVSVEPHIIQREQNRIDLVFEVDEGPLSTVKRIFFNGNRFFSDGDLRDEISSREYNVFNFLAVGDTYDPDRVNYDKQLLQGLYNRFGFIDYRLISAVGELLEDRSGFYITFALDEGRRYRIGGVSVSSEIPEVSSDDVLLRLGLRDGVWYDQDIINDKRSELSDYLGGLGYPFTEIGIELHRVEDDVEDGIEDGIEGVVDLHFNIQEGARVFVERIDINGNVRTVDSVIRREFDLVEGDPYDRNKINISRRRLERLGYFSRIGVRENQGSVFDRALVEINLEEKSTGLINFGVGYSTLDGALFKINLQERNLLGRAHEIDIAYTNSKRKDEFLIGYARPYFLGYNIKAGIELFNRQQDQEESLYEVDETGISLSANYPLASYLSQRLTYTLANQEVERRTSTTSALTTTTGVSSVIGQTLRYDRRNSFSNPTRGYSLTLANDLAGIGGEYHYLRTIVEAVYYDGIGRSDWNWLAGAQLGHIMGWNGEDVRSSDRFYLGGNNLRGFRSRGAGPLSARDGFALGGTSIFTGTFELRRSILPESFGMKASIFSDIGWIGGIENDNELYRVDAGLMDDLSTPNVDESQQTVSSVVEASSVRASVGVGTSVLTPIGPMRFDFAWPIKKEDSDRDRVFLFSFSSRF